MSESVSKSHRHPIITIFWDMDACPASPNAYFADIKQYFGNLLLNYNVEDTFELSAKHEIQWCCVHSYHGEQINKLSEAQRCTLAELANQGHTVIATAKNARTRLLTTMIREYVSELNTRLTGILVVSNDHELIPELQKISRANQWIDVGLVPDKQMHTDFHGNDTLDELHIVGEWQLDTLSTSTDKSQSETTQ